MYIRTLQVEQPSVEAKAEIEQTKAAVAGSSLITVDFKEGELPPIPVIQQINLATVLVRTHSVFH